MRPATVWRTRVTVTSTLAVDRLRAALDHDHRAVVEIADALARILARLDDPDPQVLARQERGLHGVCQRVDVQHADALQVGDAIQVQVVREHGAPVLLRQGDELGVDLRGARHVLVDDLDRGRRGLAHSGQDLEAASPAGAAQGIGAVREPLDLVEDEARHLQDAEQEPGIGDVRDPPVDDRAGVHQDARHAGHLAVRRGCRMSPMLSAAVIRSWRLATVSPTIARPRNMEMPIGATVPIAPGSADSGNPSSRPRRRPRNRPMIAVTNSAVERAWTARSAASAGITVRYGRSVKPSTIQAITQAATSSGAPGAGSNTRQLGRRRARFR